MNCYRSPPEWIHAPWHSTVNFCWHLIRQIDQTRGDGGAMIPATAPRALLLRRAFTLEWLTIGWMSAEAIVAIASGVIAHSLTLAAFGVDSVIELLSAGVLIWRLDVELQHGERFSEEIERRTQRMAAGLLFVLAAYIVIGAAWKLSTHRAAEFSLSGLIISGMAIPVMYALARQKLKVAASLGSKAMRADAAESITC